MLQNEHRTSLTMFACDEVDGSAASPCSTSALQSEGNNTLGLTMINQRLALPLSVSNTGTPWQSKSCPCSPKIMTNKARQYSPESSVTNPSSSKFSLSSSLLAIHRQAYNSLRGDFFKTDNTSKSDLYDGECSKTDKTNSRASSIKLQRSHCSIYEEDTSTLGSEDDEYPPVQSSNRSDSVKRQIKECHSLPTLKLSRMTRSGGSSSSKENRSIAPQVVEEQNSTENEGAYSALPAAQALNINVEHHSTILPDLIPKVTGASNIDNSYSSCDTDAQVSRCQITDLSSFSIRDNGDCVNQGVLNLGFDGWGESSDFNDVEVEQSSDSTDLVAISESGSSFEQVQPQIHGMSLGYSAASNSVTEGYDVPSNANLQPITGVADVNSSVNTSEKRKIIPNLSLSSSSNDSCSSLSSSDSTLPSVTVASSAASTPSTVPCSPSALRIRVMDDKPSNFEYDKTKLPSLRPNLLQQTTTASDAASCGQLQQQGRQQLSLQQQQLSSNVSAVVDSSSSNIIPVNPHLKKGVETGQLPERRSTLYTQQQQGQATDSGVVVSSMAATEEEDIADDLEEARALVYWWQDSGEKEQQGEEEYCSQQGKCSQQKVSNDDKDELLF